MPPQRTASPQPGWRRVRAVLQRGTATGTRSHGETYCYQNNTCNHKKQGFKRNLNLFTAFNIDILLFAVAVEAIRRNTGLNTHGKNTFEARSTKSSVH